MQDLSIHVDESGDFGDYNPKYAPYYILSMVLHKQTLDISKDIKRLDEAMAHLGYFNHVIHAGPLIRKEDVYCNLSPNERRAILSKLYFFAKNSPIKFKTFVISRKEYPTNSSLQSRLCFLLSQFIEDNLSFFLSFDHVILYYDNGQIELSQILLSTFQSHLSSLIRKNDVHPYKYKLLQVADMLCTLRLAEIKAKTNSLSKSELGVFHSVKDLWKDYLRQIKEKEF